MKSIPTRRLGVNGPEVSAVGLGTMGIGAHYGKTDESSAFKALTYAADRGMTFWDCADIYGTSELRPFPTPQSCGSTDRSYRS